MQNVIECQRDVMVNSYPRVDAGLERYCLKARTFRDVRFRLAATWSLTSTGQASTIVRHRSGLKMATGSFAAMPNFKGIVRLSVLATTRRYLGVSTGKFHPAVGSMSDTPMR